MDRTNEQLAGTSEVVTTSVVGGPAAGQMRVVRVASGRAQKPGRAPGSLAEANRWLRSHGAVVDAHARASTKGLIGRDEV